MCGLLTLLLLVGGFLGVFGISSAVVMPVEPIGSVQVTVVQALEMTPTFTPAPLMAALTPTPERTAARLLAPTLTPSPTALAPADPQILGICAPPEQSDLQVAAKFEGNILQSPAWMLSATSTESMTRFTWNNSAYGSVAMLELLHYDCGYTDDDIDTFYSDGVWDTLFASYESWEETALCFVGRLRLHEFATTYAGANYTIRYWVDPISDQRVAAFMLVYPEWGLDDMDLISAQLRPDLPLLRQPMIASYVYQGTTYTVDLERLPDGTYRALIDGESIPFRAVAAPNGGTILVLGEERLTTHVVRAGNERHIAVGGAAYTLTLPETRGSKRGAAGAGGGDLTAHMPGQVREIMVAEGATVDRGQPILLLEAMKMEIRVTAPLTGTVKRLLVSVGDVVERGQRLAEIG